VTTLIDPSDSLQLDFVVEMLRDGRPVGLPTETVYGLAALADDEAALARIFELKARPRFDPLIVHVLDWDHARPWIREHADLHRKLAEAFWPGPLTLLFRKSQRIPDLCTAGSDWVAIRSPAHAVFRSVLEKLSGRALAAPSANRFASISPTTASDVVTELGPYGLEAVVEGGACEHGLESTVLKIHSNSELEILRPGALSREQIEAVVGTAVKLRVRQSGTGVEDGEEHVAPGQHRVHYAPSKALYLVAAPELEKFIALRGLDPSQGALFEVFPTSLGADISWRRRVCLSENRSWSEAASKLFSLLRSLDADDDLRFIVALECAPESLGLAISDRLRRASAKTS